MNKGLCIYTLLNIHTISELNVVYRLTDSKKNFINWINGPSLHTPKTQPNIQPKFIFSIIFNVGLKDF